MLRAARRATRRALLALALTTAAVASSVAPAYASASSDTVGYTNSARADHGLGSLSVASDLSRLAQQHAEWMAAHKTLAHTSDLGGKVCCWRSVGENVGYGSTARQIFNAFMNSSSHRSNILSSRYTQIGVGAARSSDGRLWVDQIFRQPDSSAPSGSTSSSSTPQHRASRSSTRAPLHLAAAPRVFRPSAAQLRAQQLAARVRELRPVRGADPISHSIVWLDLMKKVTAR